jgi:hypothetical protein
MSYTIPRTLHNPIVLFPFGRNSEDPRLIWAPITTFSHFYNRYFYHFDRLLPISRHSKVQLGPFQFRFSVFIIINKVHTRVTYCVRHHMTPLHQMVNVKICTVSKRTSVPVSCSTLYTTMQVGIKICQEEPTNALKKYFKNTH